MIVNVGEQNIEELILDQSDNTSLHSENPARIEDIFEWIDGIPLSKTTKNLARDFSDAVLMSEILKFYYPHLVKVHNYIPANSSCNKKENWNTLNRKVLSKIDLRLSPETIDQLSHSQNGVIEKVLMDFRDKQLAIKEKEFNKSDSNRIDQSDTKSLSEEQINISLNNKSMFIRIYDTFKNFFGRIFGILIAIICFWQWFYKKSECELVTINTITVRQHEDNKRSKITGKTCHHEEKQTETTNGDEKLHESYTQVLQELHLKKETIRKLYQKLYCAERAMKLKDFKINTLTNQLEQNSQESLSSARLNYPTANNLKMTPVININKTQPLLPFQE